MAHAFNSLDYRAVSDIVALELLLDFLQTIELFAEYMARRTIHNRSLLNVGPPNFERVHANPEEVAQNHIKISKANDAVKDVQLVTGTIMQPIQSTDIYASEVKVPAGRAIEKARIKSNS